LRHGAVKEGLNIDNEGFVSVPELLTFLHKNNSDIDTLEKLQNIAQKDSKQRFLLVQRDDIWFIRANQGHSISTVTEDALTLITDPNAYPDIIHGTFRKNLESIKLTGLSRMKRNHIHLSSGMDASSGIRKTGNVFIYIDLPLAMSEGVKFYISDNGVILTPGNDDGVLLPKYFKQIVARSESVDSDIKTPRALDTKGNDLLLPKVHVRSTRNSQPKVKPAKEPTIPCAGCLVFRLKDDVQEVCVISTHNGVYGFPKGKRNKGEDIQAAALRELEEETGITVNDIAPLQSHKYVDEPSRAGDSIAIRLFMTTLTTEVVLKPKDIEEIDKCEFLPVDVALPLLMPKRQDVLKAAIALL